ncbi:MAG: DUF58 domain-containing protein [Deltaproteobacteria bacterium]|nr:DUF58 domain-containing protein [Deltaproteobacteria bacterium]MBW2376142.1 DUF58 domain-containing protein [Deltaproteobacteria bacterium]MBW2585625.1 DUF58 domain-containing protein [Deltaproteobacteria bacterium]
MISRELVKKLKKIEIYTSRLANDQLAGSYHSVFKGRGMAFSEVRQYQPGDDVRFIDWNVSARMNDTYVKVFTEEREMTVMLLVDLSASGRFGSAEKPKVETVAEVAALLAFSAIKNNDRVGLILFTDRVERFVPPKKGRSHVMRVVTEILNADPEGEGTDLGVALDLLGGIGKRRTVAFLISDFIADQYEKPLKVVSAKHDLIPIQIVDPREDELPDVGLALIEDLETGELVEVDTSDLDVRADYAREAQRQRAAREHLFRRLQLDHVTVSTDHDFVRPLTELFRLRQRRLTGYR